MNLDDIKSFALAIKGEDYYNEYRLLKEDLDFFNMYISRNRKSAFSFTLIPCQFSTYTAFKDIYEAFGLYTNALENAYIVYTDMKAIITDLYYDRQCVFNNSEIKEFANYIRDDFSLDIEDYVGCFAVCDGVASTKKKLHEIIHSDEDEVFTV